MKISNIEIKNFRAFPKSYQIDLHNAGKNLLVYGENGSGKSSLYLALKYFFESGVVPNDEGNGFEKHQNIFIKDPGHIKLSIAEEQTFEWSEDFRDTNIDLIIETSIVGACPCAHPLLEYQAWRGTGTPPYSPTVDKRESYITN